MEEPGEKEHKRLDDLYNYLRYMVQGGAGASLIDPRGAHEGEVQAFGYEILLWLS